MCNRQITSNGNTLTSTNKLLIGDLNDPAAILISARCTALSAFNLGFVAKEQIQNHIILYLPMNCADVVCAFNQHPHLVHDITFKTCYFKTKINFNILT